MQKSSAMRTLMPWMGEMMAWKSSKQFWLWLLLFWRFLGACFWKWIPGIQIWWSTGCRHTQTCCSPSTPFTRTFVASLGFCTSRNKAADNCVRHNSPCKMLFALEPSWTACWKLLLSCESNLVLDSPCSDRPLISWLRPHPEMEFSWACASVSPSSGNCMKHFSLLC